MYDMPDEIDVRAEGPLRIITLNRPGDLNAVNEGLHSGLARIWGQLNRDLTARAAVITGSGEAFSAGGDFNFIKALSEDDDLRARTLADGRDIVLGMVRCRVPVVAAVNGPAVGLGCSLVALSDVVYIAEDAFLSDPHVQVGLVAADGGPLTWPLHMSLLLAKEYALTGARISARKAVEVGLANHVAADPLDAAISSARRIANQSQQAVESTKRMLNMHLERAVLAVLDYANTAEDMSLQSDELRDNIAKLTAGSRS
jgi:enoyl-CoA hydratase